ncbi:metabotropic glutamate receptor-like [Elysia marginata]|uniref:Metabotropic glutamate receptor-like n=1 Tax=Elysia marginata TaxID=1093978 RepID=A0AAV4EEY5_9GAST|nr:metabotropic glutamate receptor-like [Elysia marginata]
MMPTTTKLVFHKSCNQHHLERGVRHTGPALPSGLHQLFHSPISITAVLYVTLVLSYLALTPSHGYLSHSSSSNIAARYNNNHHLALLNWPATQGDFHYSSAAVHGLAASSSGSASTSAAQFLPPSRVLGESSTSASPEKIATEGDVVFGGLFPMHEQGVAGTGQTCGRIKREKGIQRLEAMLYAVDLINSDPGILPGLTIGMHVLDTCSDDTFALEQCMDFIKAQLSSMDAEEYICGDRKPPVHKPLRPVAGVIGAASSPVSIMVANILRLFKALKLHAAVALSGKVVHVCVTLKSKKLFLIPK